MKRKPTCLWTNNSLFKHKYNRYPSFFLILAQKENECSFIVFLFCVTIHVQHCTHTGLQNRTCRKVWMLWCSIKQQEVSMFITNFQIAHLHQSDEYLKLTMQIWIFATWAVVFPESHFTLFHCTISFVSLFYIPSSWHPEQSLLTKFKISLEPSCSHFSHLIWYQLWDFYNFLNALSFCFMHNVGFA